ncbi:hypothetical protein ACIRO1_36580 [Streptomyces sp. NPDC102381]|uniref:hypothetical protein n=1 Tax=Streptomyces sp. NPDC102381 TaxID=3366164 RepID=UPI0038247592
MVAKLAILCNELLDQCAQSSNFLFEPVSASRLGFRLFAPRCTCTRLYLPVHERQKEKDSAGYLCAPGKVPEVH